MSIMRCDRHDEEYDTDHRCECIYCEQEQAQQEEAQQEELDTSKRADRFLPGGGER